MLNRPNTVLEKQRHFQAPSQTPLWLKGPRDKFIVSIVFAAIGVGLAGVFVGTVKMSKGTK
ncbi:hypothetical protein BDF14DRAFT_1880817 [Spinellus fusiger]|nr:hypothetical protein BDF14DRAFT_1880817 [Spinellus fusiger]